jgi:septal ring factor EnvC (AmiA/AmiB activator)
MNDDFIDLRSGNLSTESFWPSFTDIMTVVVMIFLITSVILMVRNWELIDQLRTSLLAEQRASEMIRSTTEVNATLEEQLAQAQHEISVLRMQLMQTSEDNNMLNRTLADKEQQIIVIMSDKHKLQSELSGAEQEIASLDNQLQQVIIDLDELSKSYREQSTELKTAVDKLVILSEEKEAQSRQLVSLETDYSSLKVKYDKLVKPARTAKGKYVVEVNYEKIKGKGRIRFKDAGEENYTTLSSKQLHSKLAALRKQHPKDLYIKIIIPESSGLSYSEAWEFMRNTLHKYDYYYQEES